MPSTHRFTVLICTYNQAESLATVLDCLSQQRLADPDRVELIVVDNNSRDDTAQVCAQREAVMPFSFRYVFEPRQGLSVARNRGVAEAAGDIVIFTDDDARIPDDWLQSYVEAYDASDADCVYGKILIDWARGKPHWYLDRYQSMFVGLDYGDQPLAIKDHKHEFYGKNFSMKKSLILEFGGFNENLGRKGSKLFVGEESQLYRKLFNKGCAIHYRPNIYLFHILKEHEYTVAHIVRYYADATESMYYMACTSARRRILGRPANILYKIGVFSARLPLELLKVLIQPDQRNRLYLSLEVKRHFRLLMLWLSKQSA